MPTKMNLKTLEQLRQGKATISLNELSGALECLADIEQPQPTTRRHRPTASETIIIIQDEKA